MKKETRKVAARKPRYMLGVAGACGDNSYSHNSSSKRQLPIDASRAARAPSQGKHANARATRQ